MRTTADDSGEPGDGVYLGFSWFGVDPDCLTNAWRTPMAHFFTGSDLNNRPSSSSWLTGLTLSLASMFLATLALGWSDERDFRLSVNGYVDSHEMSTDERKALIRYFDAVNAAIWVTTGDIFKISEAFGELSSSEVCIKTIYAAAGNSQKADEVMGEILALTLSTDKRLGYYGRFLSVSSDLGVGLESGGGHEQLAGNCNASNLKHSQLTPAPPSAG